MAGKPICGFKLGHVQCFLACMPSAAPGDTHEMLIVADSAGKIKVQPCALRGPRGAAPPAARDDDEGAVFDRRPLTDADEDSVQVGGRASAGGGAGGARSGSAIRQAAMQAATNPLGSPQADDSVISRRSTASSAAGMGELAKIMSFQEGWAD
eukprot:TRINITY_DN46215_c0_g1_i1.p1 TRINITY_DN46215_c0_g1~~TRINITY_DN46215_c0_g1_i1.p1  ORF type:complete len:170 (-),score=37.76 TRINITY_DN46215_c0_g1_i1:76-534(-)